MIKIATWNVNSILARLDLVLAWLKEKPCDIILLQELKTREENFPEALLDLGYNALVYGQKSYNGVAILSKWPLEDTQKGLPGFEEDPSARYVEAFTNGLRVASVYVPNGQSLDSDKFTYKLNFLSHLTAHLKTLATYNEDCIIGGDFNIAPSVQDTPPLENTERILTSAAERTSFSELTASHFKDAIQFAQASVSFDSKDWYTWWDYRQGSWPKNRGFRIDHLLMPPSTINRIETMGVDKNLRGQTRPSDHAPLWCTLKR